MDGSSLIAAVMPFTTLVALFTGIALPFIAASRPGRSHAGRPLARGDDPKPTATDAAPAGYLYVPCVRTGSGGSPAATRRWVQQVPIVSKTAQRIYYASDSWDRREAAISPGCISREQFETDTRCPHGCPAGTGGVRCAQHGHARGHGPHRDDRCRHGYPAGVIPVPGDRPGPAGRLFFATRQAAEDHLHRGERAGPAAPHPPPIRQLRRAMADAHPDRGGTAGQFIQARRRYQTALQAARR
jgi:hypothetical protein